MTVAQRLPFSCFTTILDTVCELLGTLGVIPRRERLKAACDSNRRATECQFLSHPESSLAMKSESAKKMRHHQAAAARHGLSLIELLVTIAILGILIALLLPAISATRESARRVQCTNQLRQIGIGLNAYHDALGTFPPGYVAGVESGRDGKGWGWGALLLPFIEQGVLADQLNTSWQSFDAVAADIKRAPFLRSNVDLYLCPSDTGGGESHRFRSIIIHGEVRAENSLVQRSPRELDTTETVMAHVFVPPRRPRYNPPRRLPKHEVIRSEPVPVPARIAKSNYVGSFGSEWKSQRQDWNNKDFEGNGLFGRNSAVSVSKIIDGTSKTIAVGERSMRNYAAAWAGSNSWKGCGFADNQMVVGTAFYPINDAPINQNIDCDGRGSANFSSNHYGGATFLFADGSVRFLPQELEPGVFQNLAQRNDREKIGDF